MISRKPGFDHKSVPGFILVPAKDFTAESLHTYVMANITECRSLAKTFVEQEKLKLKINNALAGKRTSNN